MIAVKGAKSTSEPTDPAAPYARKPEEKSGAVSKVSLLLVSVVLSFKAFLSGGTKAEEAPAPEKSSSEEAPAPGVAVVSGGLAAEDPEAVRQHADNLPPASFELTPGGDTIAFSAPRPIVSPIFQPAGYIAQQANDNTAPGMMSSPMQSVPNLPRSAPGSGSELKNPDQDGENPDLMTPADPIISEPKPSAPHSGEAPGNGKPVAPDTPFPSNPEPGDPVDGPNLDEDAKGDDDNENDSGPDPMGNRAPRLTGPVFLNDISGCAVLTIGLAELLSGAVDPDGDTLSVADVTTSSGKLSMAEAGHWEFSPEGDLGPVTISYQISDGALAVNQTLHFTVVPTQISGGTDRDDILVGTMCADDIDAGAGDDLVDALAGDDIIQGGAGHDHILAGEGDDFVHGGAGDDIIFGGTGNDEIRGAAGNDRLFGEAGNDTLIGGRGDDTIRGGVGDDEVSGGEGNDHLLGDAGDDLIFGDGGADVIEGGEGDDRLMGGLGDDHLSGGTGSDVLLGEAGNDTLEAGTDEDVVLAGEGDDRVIAAADGADDRYDAGEGCDLLDYSATEGDLAVDLVGGRATGIEIGDDRFSGFERFATGSGDDIIRFGGSAVSISGGEGCNTFEFVASANALTSSPGQDRQTSYRIEDFAVGDRLRMSTWEIFAAGADDAEDAFDRVYGGNADNVPIRYRNEWADALEETVIEADLDGDNFHETAIILDGRHALVLAETA